MTKFICAHCYEIIPINTTYYYDSILDTMYHPQCIGNTNLLSISKRIRKESDK